MKDDRLYLIHVMRVAQQDVPPGSGRIIAIDGSGLGSGVYFYRVSAEIGGEQHVETGRMTLVK